MKPEVADEVAYSLGDALSSLYLCFHVDAYNIKTHIVTAPFLKLPIRIYSVFVELIMDELLKGYLEYKGL